MTDQIIVYGTTWCPDCKRAKRFFAEQRVPYVNIDIERDAEAMALVERINRGMRSIPTIVFPDGSILVEPSNAQLAEKLNLQTKAQRTYYDTIVIGGGPAGLTAALYLAREGLDTLVIEKAGLGGQAGITQTLDNFPGFDEGIAGAEFADRLARQARRFGVETLQAQDVIDLAPDGPYLCVTTRDGSQYGSKAVLLGTGARYRRLEVPGEEELIGVNVHFCATCDGAFYKGKRVLVIGGGNSGFEEGLFLTKFATQVDIVEFNAEAKASQILQQKVAEKSNMTVTVNHAVKELKGQSRLEAIVVQDRATGELKEWHYDGVFVFIGLLPNSDLVKDKVEIDRYGFVVTDRSLMTTLPGLFAAGDVRAGSTKQAASAAG
ncbi:MAG: FAD-dependent oxidoreductase, partial [Chloroflexi bacterium]|nr:FAD-dependent oxidoreductase [Chloroflexota bacterium]